MVSTVLFTPMMKDFHHGSRGPISPRTPTTRANLGVWRIHGRDTKPGWQRNETDSHRNSGFPCSLSLCVHLLMGKDCPAVKITFGCYLTITIQCHYYCAQVMVKEDFHT
jgi:hypothetical protein